MACMPTMAFVELAGRARSVLHPFGPQSPTVAIEKILLIGDHVPPGPLVLSAKQYVMPGTSPVTFTHSSDPGSNGAAIVIRGEESKSMDSDVLYRKSYSTPCPKTGVRQQ